MCNLLCNAEVADGGGNGVLGVAAAAAPTGGGGGDDDSGGPAALRLAPVANDFSEAIEHEIFGCPFLVEWSIQQRIRRVSFLSPSPRGNHVCPIWSLSRRALLLNPVHAPWHNW